MKRVLLDVGIDLLGVDVGLEEKFGFIVGHKIPLDYPRLVVFEEVAIDLVLQAVSFVFFFFGVLLNFGVQLPIIDC